MVSAPHVIVRALGVTVIGLGYELKRRDKEYNEVSAERSKRLNQLPIT